MYAPAATNKKDVATKRQQTRSMFSHQRHTIRYDTIRYGIFTCARKL